MKLREQNAVWVKCPACKDVRKTYANKKTVCHKCEKIFAVKFNIVKGR